jgi:acetylornithine deacetylase/succinyl-diaminopimelate desuccinylase-like protein
MKSSKFPLGTTLEYISTNRPRFLNQLIEFLRIPSISTLTEHRPDVEQAAEWLAADMRRIGLQQVAVLSTTGNPVAYGEWLGAGPDAPTVLLYGHYDVQPVDPLELWQTSPFEPTLKDGRLYARGASDNKAQHFAHLKAIEAMLATNGRLPINVKVMIDGEEEVGSPSLAAFVAENRERLAADSLLISDGPMVAPDQPSIVYAMRGVVSMEVRLRGPRRDLHSGIYGGSVLNPAQVVAAIVAALHEPDGRVAIPGFYDQVTPLSAEEKALLNQIPNTLPVWQEETGLQTPWGEAEYSLLERVAARPTCEINGIWGGYQGEGSKTIIPAEAGVKISMRLVAAQDPAEIARLFHDYVMGLAPAGVQVEVWQLDGSAAAMTPYNSPQIEAARRALHAAWGIEPVISRLGGSLPIVETLQRELGDIPYVLIPFGLDDNRHAPNEFFRLDYLWRGIETAVHYHHYLAKA